MKGISKTYKIVKAEIEGVIRTPLSNEPYKTERLEIQKITHYYQDGGRDSYYNSAFGALAEPEFYEIFPNSCEVTVIVRPAKDIDEYYTEKSFKNACFNRSNENPYDLPNWTKL